MKANSKKSLVLILENNHFDPAKKRILKIRSFLAQSMVADVSFTADLDRQIASVMDCNPLLEDEVIRLCEKVRTALDSYRSSRQLYE